MWTRGPGQGAEEREPFLFQDEVSMEQELKPWDLFKDPPRKMETGSMADSKFFDTGEKVLKVIAYIVTFIVVLGSAVLSKGTLLFMTSQISNNTKPYCNKNLGSNKQFVVTLPTTERVVWIWLLFFSFCVPQVGTFIRSVRICMFKKWKWPQFTDFLLLLLTETLPTVGSAIMIFCVLPELDVIKGAMLANALCFIPGFVGFMTRDPSCSASSLKLALDVTAMLSQASSFVVWPMLEDKPMLWLIPVSVILISFGWWENYVSEATPIKFLKNFAKKMKDFDNNRYVMYIFISLWKCVVFFISMVVIFEMKEGNVAFLFDNYKAGFNDHRIYIHEIKPVINLENEPNVAQVISEVGVTDVVTNYMTPIWVFLINIGASYVCYIFAKFACKVWIQRFSFAFPLNLTMPVAISGLIAMTSAYARNDCVFVEVIPSYLFFDSPPIYMLKDFIGHQQSWIWLIWLLSQTWITIHVWSPTCERRDRTEKLFVRPMYDAFFVDQDIALNRRREDKTKDEDVLKKDDEVVTDIQKSSDKTTKIFACATMWHETREEMMEFLKSIMRLDSDQSARRLVRYEMGITDLQDYYELETHIFFDDAFARSKKCPDPQLNKFVKDLVLAINEAASVVHEVNIEVRAPIMFTTPYGGRLIWTLPGKTQLIAHLKDKKKIRTKKRWSQVMYMYYLLGHRLVETDLPKDRKEAIADNTYILALDGDVDFQPKAVTLLLDLMRAKPDLGAACGRIHPTGSGPMVWYQMFEYAVGHWLQKATEHMIGCVLCSPGCFSLFRGKALMDYNVMKKYTTKSSEAMHYVQYDQGEDRWLCTLLLQRGYRVEYSAASDAYTHCPEGFNEFYNQRRRWMPSTTANILDLLMDYKHTIAINDNISRLYILYQVVLMVGTILGPGTIFLMLVGAFVAAFQMDQWTSFAWNVVPILVFMLVCKVFKTDTVQLFFAGVISAIYGLVMMAVLVGVMLQISNDGPLAPSSLFFFCVAGEMILTGLLHPKELNCLIYGVVYYVTVPSMYMLLVIYSVFNMNVTSWGTREGPTENIEGQPQQSQVKKEENMKDKVMGFFSNNNQEEAGTFDFSMAGLFRCMLCTHEVRPVERYKLEEIQDNMVLIMKKLDNIAKGVQDEEQSDPIILLEGTNQVSETKVAKGRDSGQSIVPSNQEEDGEAWLEDETLHKGEREYISHQEIDFWNGLLDKYLTPIEETKEEENEKSKKLIDLRDKAVAAFFMLNALFVLIIFLLTLKKDLLHVKWPFDVKTNFTFNPTENQVTMTKQYLQLEPIGLVFLFFFAILLVVQFIAMLFHRFATLCQIISNTVIDFSLLTSNNVHEMTDEELIKGDPVKLAKKLQRLKGVDDNEMQEEQPGRRKTVAYMIDAGMKTQPSVVNLDEAYKRRYAAFESNPDKHKGPIKKDTMAALQRRTTVFRKSMAIPQSQGGGPRGNFAFES